MDWTQWYTTSSIFSLSLKRMDGPDRGARSVASFLAQSCEKLYYIPDEIMRIDGTQEPHEVARAQNHDL